MTWWVICFAAVIVTIFSKWYFADNISRLRQSLSRQQRETLELKETLQDARKTLNEYNVLNKGKDLEITRNRKRIADLKSDLQNRKNSPKAKK